jgi:hypothetical protein
MVFISTVEQLGLYLYDVGIGVCSGTPPPPENFLNETL